MSGRQAQRGAVYVEFLVVFLPFFILFLWLVQMSFAYAARLVVQHSATRAARSAVVILPDERGDYGGAPVNQISYSGSGPTPLNTYLGGLGFATTGEDGGGPRLRAIRAAASAPLLAVAPTERARQPGGRNLERSIGVTPGPFDRAATGVTSYHPAALAVTFPTAPEAQAVRSSFGPSDLVTVRVTYLFYCSVPIVAVMGCDSLEQARGQLAPEELAQMVGGLDPDGRFMVLRAEASLPNQGRGP